MICNSSFWYFFSIFSCFFAGTVEAIIDGLTVQGSVISYQVSVRIHDESHVCGGGIISVRYILTAAHCVLNQTRHLRSMHMSILARTNDLHKTSRPAVTIQVEKVFFPREFHPTAEFSHGDIAILKLRELLYGAELYEQRLPKNYQPPDSRAAIAGFGWNKYHLIDNKDVGSTDGLLRFAMTRVLSDDECEKSYPHGAVQSDVHICAVMQVLEDDVNQYGVCHGDSGGTLISESQVIGILSRIAPHCNEREKPAVYTRVAHYAGMILNVIEQGCDANVIELHTQLHRHKEPDRCNIL